MLDAHADQISAALRECVMDALSAGETELAAITAVEVTEATPDEINELARLAVQFDATDAAVAGHVVQTARARFAAA